MYSIQILNYNRVPKLLLDNLTFQCSRRTEVIHVTVWDDGSSSELQNILSGLQNKYGDTVDWNLSARNHGRAAMRQRMLHSVKTGWIISIDSDMIPDPDFVDQMISALKDPGTVYAGYHYYQDQAPVAHHLLHWNYGRKREVPAQDKDLYSHFSTGVFALHASVAKNLYFEHTIQTYGHEDTLFGLLLQEKNVPVQLTKMKAIHQGLSSTEVFINKQLGAILNLKVVLARYPEYENRLIQWGQSLNRIPGIKQLLTSDRIKQYCIKKLQQNPNRLIYLDVLKLNAYVRTVSR